MTDKKPPRSARETVGLNHMGAMAGWSFCRKCGMPAHIGPCPGDEVRPVTPELTRLRRQNRRLRRKLARERGSWDRALEVAARIAEIAGVYDGAKVAAMIRAAKIGGEE